MASDSKTSSLVETLGIVEGMKLIILNAPPRYTFDLGELPPNIDKKINPHGSFDFIQYFALNKQELEFKFAWLKQHTKPDGILWVSWMKKTTGFATDLDEKIIRNMGTRHGMKDGETCSINDWWVALKFTFEKK